MDDLQEQETADLENLGQFCFVSCWTEDAVEQIPMWKMYTSLDSGVRIKLPKYPFLEMENRPEDMEKLSGIQIIDETEGEYPKTIIPFRDMIERGFITPDSFKQERILHKVEYTADKNKLYPRIFNQTNDEMSFALGKMGKYKSLGWDFQREWRYILRILPFDIANVSKMMENISLMANQLRNGTATLPFSYYDLHINDEAFSKMEIMLSPKINAGNRVIVRDLVEKYNPSAIIVESDYKDKIA